MKAFLHKYASPLFILFTLCVVCYIAFSNSELIDAWDKLFTLDFTWLCVAFLCLFAFIFFDSLTYFFFLRKQGKPISLGYSLFIAIMGLYFSNITPGASGGQPMQIYYIRKKNISVGMGTSAITVRFLCNQTTMVLVGCALWIAFHDFVNEQLAGIYWIVVIGVSINGIVVPLVLLTLFHRPLVQGLLNGIIRLGAKLRLVKNVDNAILHGTQILDTYHASMMQIVKNPMQLIIQFFISTCSMLGLLMIPVAVYFALGSTGTPWYYLLTLSYLLFMSTSYTPLPGASGAQEGAFLLYFNGLFATGTIGLALLVWRFITFYFTILLGASASAIFQFWTRKKGE